MINFVVAVSSPSQNWKRNVADLLVNCSLGLSIAIWKTQPVLLVRVKGDLSRLNYLQLVLWDGMGDLGERGTGTVGR